MVTEEKKNQWEFPEDVVVNRAMLDALLYILVENRLVKTDAVVERFQENLKTYLKEYLEQRKESLEKVPS